MKRKIKSIIKQSIRKLGFDLVKTNRHETKMPFLKNRLTNLIKLVFESSIIVDGGAHIGTWTKSVSKFFRN
jgi:hypothetical protein